MQATESTEPSAARAGAIRIAGLGHALFAASLITLGVMGLARRGFTSVWSGVPKGLPARVVLAYLCAALCLGSGVAMLWRRAAAITARVLVAWLALWMLLFRLPLVVRAPKASEAWWATGETAVLLAAAWVLYARFAGERSSGRPGFLASDRGLSTARVLYGLGLIPFGVAHFTFLERTVSMVPGWLPWHLSWAYFTGGAFIAAGIGIATGVLPRLAATLSVWEMGLFTLIVWVPLIVAGPDASQWDEFVDSCVLTGAAWLVADSCRGMAWLGIGTRTVARRDLGEAV
jgi:hypothetical protein